MDGFFNDGGRNIKHCSQKRKSKSLFSLEDDIKIWNFIAENYQNYGPFEIFTRMKEAMGFEQADRSLYYRFRNVLSPNLHLAEFDVETKLQVAKRFSLVINKNFVQELSAFMKLDIDEDGVLMNYSWRTHLSDYSSLMSSGEQPLSLPATVSHNEDLKKIFQNPHSASSSRFKRNRKSSSLDASTSSQLPNTSAIREIVTQVIEESNQKLLNEIKSTNEELAEKLRSKDIKPPQDNNMVEKPGLKHYLEGLKGLLNHLNAPELTGIQLRLASIESKLGDRDEPLSIESVHSMFDIGLKLLGG